MAKDDLGTKQLCPECGAKFYDLNKRPAECPKCGARFDPEDDIVKTTKAKLKARKAGAPRPGKDDEDDDIEDDVDTARSKVSDDEADEEDDGETARELGSDDDEVVVESTDDEDTDDVTGKKVPVGFTDEGVDDDDDDVILEEDEEDFEIDGETNIDLDEEVEADADGDGVDEKADGDKA